MKCINCGAELEAVFDATKGIPFQIGYQCLNCKIEWTLAEHKDNQNWAVRHIRALEAQVKELQTALDQLLKKLGV